MAFHRPVPRHTAVVSLLVVLSAGWASAGHTTSHGVPRRSATHHAPRPDAALERPDPGGLPDGGAVQSLVFTAGEPSILYAAFRFGGVFRSADAGGSWTPADRGLPPTLPCELAADPRQRDTLFAACLGRLFTTIDGGQRWQQLDVDDAELPLIAPSDSRVIYQPLGGMLSRDGGRRWSVQPRSGPEWSRLPLVAIDPADPSHLFAAGDNGVEHSRDGGIHWTALNSGLDAEHRGEAIAISPLDPRVLIVRTSESTYRTDDGGADWRPIGRPLPPANVTLFRFDGRTVDVLTTLNQDELLRSTDGGDHWRSLSAPLEQAVTAWATHPSNARLIAVGSSRGVFVTLDEGATWTPAFAGISRAEVTVSVGDGVPAQLHAQVAGEVLTSADEGRSWIVARRTVPPETNQVSQPAIARAVERFTSVYGGSGAFAGSVATSPARPERLFLGTGGLTRPQLWRSDDTGGTWRVVRTCSERWPGPHCAAQVDPGDPDIVYALTLDGFIDGGAALARSTDGGLTWVEDSVLGSIHLFALVATRPTTALAWAGAANGGRQLYRSDDHGVHWTAAGASLPDDITLTSIVSVPADPAHLFAGTAGRGVFHSRDRGATWAPLR